MVLVVLRLVTVSPVSVDVEISEVSVVADVAVLQVSASARARERARGVRPAVHRQGCVLWARAR